MHGSGSSRRLSFLPSSAAASARVGAHQAGIMATPAVPTITEIDTEIIAAHWAYLHGTWEGRLDLAEEAREATDRLLELRHQLLNDPFAWPG
jgi:hypothetical protein